MLFSEIFSWREIQTSKTLQRVFWVFLFLFFLDTARSSERLMAGMATNKTGWDFVCWPHFQSCSSLFVLEAHPLGVSYPLVMMLLLASGGFAAIQALRNRWDLAQKGLIALILWRLFAHFFLQQTGQANFQYYSLPLMLIWAFFPRKEDLMRLAFVLMYAFAATVKFDSSWIEGTYFSSMDMGLPLLPNAIEHYALPLFTNAVIYFEIFASFGLLSSKARLQRWSFWGWILFHLYSILIVGYFYPLHCLPMIYLLFSGGPVSNPLGKRLPAVGYAALLFIIALNMTFPLISLFTQREHRFSQEAYQYGLGMIDSNYQCRVEWEPRGKDGESLGVRHYESRDATQRCAPYPAWFRLRERCRKDPLVASIRYRHDLSVNGSPFYRIVDVDDACVLNYSWLEPNPWIVTPRQGAAVVGYASPNAMRNSNLLYPGHEGSIVSSEPVPNERRMQLPPVVLMGLRIFNWALWCAVFAYSIGSLIYRRRGFNSAGSTINSD